MKFEDLKGKICTSIIQTGDEEILFVTDEGKYIMHHHDD
jgi:hypothetical protein